MIEIILQSIILFIYIGLLFYVSKFDYDHMAVRYRDGILLVLLGIIFMIVSESYLNSFVCMVLLIMIFGVPCLFGFGLGDLLVFISLAPFLSQESIVLYLGVFFFIWIFWHIYLVRKNVIEGHLQGIRASFSKKNIMTLQYPLIPAILISFVCWMVLQILHF